MIRVVTEIRLAAGQRCSRGHSSISFCDRAKAKNEPFRSMARRRGMVSASREEIQRNLPALLPRLWRFALSLSRRADLAEDLVQNACVQILEKSHGYQAGTYFDRWAFTVMINLWRSEVRRSRAGQFESIEAAEYIADAAATRGDDAVFHQQVLAAIDRLPAPQGAAVTLVYGEGYTYEEASEILGVAIGTVMSRLHAARRKLGALNPACDPE